MTIVSDIIKEAYRESNLIALGETPSADQSQEALTRLNTLLNGIYGNEAGNPYQLWRVPEDTTVTFYTDPNTPPPDAKLICNLTSATTQYLPKFPQDGMRLAAQDLAGNFSINPLTINANGYLIEGAHSIVMNTDNDTREWLFRGDLANWVKVTPLDTFDTWPFPGDFDDYFIAMLAIRMNPRYERQTSPETLEVYKRGKDQFAARYNPSIQAPSELALARIYPHRVIGYGLPSSYFYKGYVPWF